MSGENVSVSQLITKLTNTDKIELDGPVEYMIVDARNGKIVAVNLTNKMAGRLIKVLKMMR